MNLNDDAATLVSNSSSRSPSPSIPLDLRDILTSFQHTSAVVVGPTASSLQPTLSSAHPRHATAAQHSSSVVPNPTSSSADYQDAVTARARRWSFTLFGCTSDTIDIPSDAELIVSLANGLCLQYDDDLVRYIVYQIEKCPKTGRPHAQGYIEFTNAMRLLGVKKIFKRHCGIYHHTLFGDTVVSPRPDIDFARIVHVEASYGSPGANNNYCTNPAKRWPGTDVYTRGTPATIDGVARLHKRSRSDEAAGDDDDGLGRQRKPKPPSKIDLIVKMMHAHRDKPPDHVGEWVPPARIRLRQIENTHPEWRSTITVKRRHLVDTEMLLDHEETPLQRPVTGQVWIGDPGSGKSSRPFRMYKNMPGYQTDEWCKRHMYRLTCTMGNGKWWPGLTAEHLLLVIEDMGNWLSPYILCQILDGYRLSLETKGGAVYAPWIQVVITSNVPPEKWWDYEKTRGQPNAVCPDHLFASIKSRLRGREIFVDGIDHRQDNPPRDLQTDPVWDGY